MISCSNRLARVVGLSMCVATVALTAQTAEDLARRTLQSGRDYRRAQNYVEAVKDFNTVLQQYPASTVADDALLELASYQLEVVGDSSAAAALATQLRTKYPSSDSAPMALVLEGRITLSNSRTPEAVSAALANFDRVPRLYPGSDAVPASMYFAGEATRLGGRRPEALERFNQLATQFPNSVWAANALLGSALTLTRGGQPIRAIDQLQRVRNRFPNTPEAARALDLNSVLYRLYLRTPAQPAYVFSGRAIPAPPAKLNDVVDIAVARDNTLLVASKTGVVGYGAKGNQAFQVGVADPLALSFDRAGKLLTVQEQGLRSEGRTLLPLTPPTVANKVRELKLDAAVVTSVGEYLVADGEQKALERFGADGKYLGEFAKAVEVRRMAISDLDDVAVLHRDSKAVTLFSRDGRRTTQIAERGANYQLRNPVDVAIDAFGHVYVMDRAAVLVFGPDGSRLITTFTVPEKALGALNNAEALALDAAGRLFVFDSRTDSVRVYR